MIKKVLMGLDGNTFNPIQANVGDRQETEAMAERVLGEYGKIDILVNNAGININVKD